MADEKLHGASARLRGAFGQQHVRTLHGKIVPVRIRTDKFLGSAIYIVDGGAVITAYVRVRHSGGGEEQKQQKQCGSEAAAHNGNRRHGPVLWCQFSKNGHKFRAGIIISFSDECFLRNVIVKKEGWGAVANARAASSALLLPPQLILPKKKRTKM